MPHIHLLSSADLTATMDPHGVLRELSEKLASFETVDPRSIKAYWNFFETWEMGEGAPAGFVHCTVSILSGRPLELRKRMATDLVEIIRRHLTDEISSENASVTLELREMDADTYQR